MAFKQSLNRAAKVFSTRRIHADMPPTSVNQIMMRDVLSVYPGQSFAEAVGLMANRPFRHVLVIHPNGRLAGVISDRDLLRVMGATTDWKERKVSDIMTRTFYCNPGNTTFGCGSGDAGASSKLPACALR